MGRKFKVKIQKFKMDNIYYLLEKIEETKTKHFKHWAVLKKQHNYGFVQRGKSITKKWGENALFIRKNRKKKYIEYLIFIIYLIKQKRQRQNI